VAAGLAYVVVVAAGLASSKTTYFLKDL